jgi:hypothetical protein
MKNFISEFYDEQKQTIFLGHRNKITHNNLLLVLF